MKKHRPRQSDHHGGFKVPDTIARNEEHAYFAARRQNRRNTLLRSETAKAVWAERKKVTLPPVKFLAGGDEE